MANLLGSELRRIRRRLGLSLERVAHPMDTTLNFLSMVERGERLPSEWVLRQILKQLRCPERLDEMLALKDRSRSRVIFELTGRSPAEVNMLFELLDRSERGQIGDSVASEILKLIETGKT